jgi:cyclase
MKRIVARLDIKGSNVIKGIQMEGLRIIGEPSELSKRYYEDGADEIVFIDVVASLYGRNNLSEIVQSVANNVYIPLTVGGGIRSVEDARKLLRNGADKVAVNSAAVQNPKLLKQISFVFGAQSVVLSVQAKKIGRIWEVFMNGGRDRSGVGLESWIESASGYGVGEIFVTSIDNDGTSRGLNTELMRIARNSTDLPLIGAGGIKTVEHILSGFEDCNLDAIAVGKHLHSGDLDIRQLKIELNGFGIETRRLR